jgi:uncharacterized membrane protein
VRDGIARAGEVGMAEGSRTGRLGMGVGRLEAFSDGVLAIVITLLILDIKVPPPTGGPLGRQLAAQWPEYLAYLVSFLVVGIIWLNHHATVQLLARTDHSVQVLNLLLLLPVSVLPWPTAVLAAYVHEGTVTDQRVAVVLYGATSTVMALAFNVLWRYVLRHPELQRPEVDRGLLAVRNRRYNLGLPAYPVATLLGLLSETLFLGLMLALALMYLLPTPEIRGERHAA